MLKTPIGNEPINVKLRSMSVESSHKSGSSNDFIDNVAIDFDYDGKHYALELKYSTFEYKLALISKNTPYVALSDAQEDFDFEDLRIFIEKNLGIISRYGLLTENEVAHSEYALIKVFNQSEIADIVEELYDFFAGANPNKA